MKKLKLRPLVIAISVSLSFTLTNTPLLFAKTEAKHHSVTTEHEVGVKTTTEDKTKPTTAEKKTFSTESKTSQRTFKSPTASERAKIAGDSATSASKKDLKPSDKKIEKIIKDNFNEWSNGKNEISNSDLKKLLEDPKYKGQEAAVLAALIVEMKNTGKDKYTLAQLTAALKHPDSDLYGYYQTALSNINGVRMLEGSANKLWGPTGTLSAKTHIIQMSEDDCYLLSAINSMLYSHPAKLQGMIERKNNDTFIVNFPGYATPVTVKLTDTELGMYSHLVGGGEWLAVLSVAEAKMREKLRLNPEITMQPGYQTQTLILLTGQKYKLKGMSNNMSSEKMQWVINTITASLTNNIPIGIETNVHDLSIIAYSNGMVTIKNPWGTNGWYNPKTAGWSTAATQPTTSGPWYLMKGGVFTVPIASIGDGFVDLAYHPIKDDTVTMISTSSLQIERDDVVGPKEESKQPGATSSEDKSSVKSCTVMGIWPIGCGGHE